MQLTEYIDKYFNNNQRRFALHYGYLPQQVTKWINADWRVIDGYLMSPRRKLGE